MADSESQQQDIPHSLSVTLEIFGHGEKPWYLCTLSIYSLIIKSIHSSSNKNKEIMFDKIVATIAILTKYINDMTGAQIVVMDHDMAVDLVNKLDKFISDQLLFIDDCLDYTRGLLADTLRDLIASVLKQIDLAKEKLSALSKKCGEACDAVASIVKSRFEHTINMIKSLFATFKSNYPETIATTTVFLEKSYERAEAQVNAAKESSSEIVKKADAQLHLASAYLLRTAQPYVHTAVHRSSPYLVTAVEVSQTYAVQARPYLHPLVGPLVERAQEMNAALQQHKVVGPYVVRAYDTASKTIEGVKVYCLSDEMTAEHTAGAGAGAEGASGGGDAGSEGVGQVPEIMVIVQPSEAELVATRKLKAILSIPGAPVEGLEKDSSSASANPPAPPSTPAPEPSPAPVEAH